MNIGLLGLDTSHSPAFTRILQEQFPEHPVIGAWPGGSDAIPASRDRVAGFTRDIESLGVPIFGSPSEVARHADALLILSLDGASHLPLYREVVRRGLPVFIDKPVAGSPDEAEQIFSLAEEHAAPLFSASSLRFLPEFAAAIQAVPREELRHFDLTGPLNRIEGVPLYHFYAVHSVELLVAALGPDWAECHPDPDEPERFLFRWRNGATASLRLSVPAADAGFNGALHRSVRAVPFALEAPLYIPFVGKLIEFFLAGLSPVVKEETLAIIGILEAMGTRIRGFRRR